MEIWVLVFTMVTNNNLEQQINQEYKFETQEQCEQYAETIRTENELYGIAVNCGSQQ